MDDPGFQRLQRLVRQHAETSRLLGVDFVPAFSRQAPASLHAQPTLLPPKTPTPVPPLTPEVPKQAQVAAPTRIDPLPKATPAGKPVEATPRTGGTKDRAKAQLALDELKARYEHEAPHKQFVTAHTRIVFGEGDPIARVVFVGEAPGEEEDRTGRPFVGRSGELLTKMLVAMGLAREQVYICNVMKTRPPDNATPTATEIAICEPYLREQIGIIAPEAIVTLGLPAARALLHTQESMTKMRGRWRTYELSPGVVVPLMPTFHPAYVLRNYTEETRGQVWSDLCDVVEKLGMPRPVRAKPANG